MVRRLQSDRGDRRGRPYLFTRVVQPDVCGAGWFVVVKVVVSVPPVALLKVAMGFDGQLLKAVPDLGYAGVVVEAMGAGHVPADTARSLARLPSGSLLCCRRVR